MSGGTRRRNLWLCESLIRSILASSSGQVSAAFCDPAKGITKRDTPGHIISPKIRCFGIFNCPDRIFSLTPNRARHPLRVPLKTFDQKAFPLPPAYDCHRDSVKSPQQVGRRRLISTPGGNNENGTENSGDPHIPQQTAAKHKKYDEAYNKNDAGQGRDAAAGETI